MEPNLKNLWDNFLETLSSSEQEAYEEKPENSLSALRKYIVNLSEANFVEMISDEKEEPKKPTKKKSSKKSSDSDEKGGDK